MVDGVVVMHFFFKFTYGYGGRVGNVYSLGLFVM